MAEIDTSIHVAYQHRLLCGALGGRRCPWNLAQRLATCRRCLDLAHRMWREAAMRASRSRVRNLAVRRA